MVVCFFASLRTLTQVREIAWDEPTPTVGRLLEGLADRYGPEFRRWVFEGTALSESVVVLVNGGDIRHQAGLATPLGPTDVVAILPMMAGGLRGADNSRGAGALGREPTYAACRRRAPSEIRPASPGHVLLRNTA